MYKKIFTQRLLNLKSSLASSYDYLSLINNINNIRKFSVSNPFLTNNTNSYDPTYPDRVLKKSQQLLADMQKWEHDPKRRAQLEFLAKYSDNTEKSPVLPQSPEKKVEQSSPVEKNFLTKTEDNVNNYMGKLKEMRSDIGHHLSNSYDRLPRPEQAGVAGLYINKLQTLNDNAKKESEDLEKKFSDDLKPIAYFREKVEMEARIFKKFSEVWSKEENALNEAIKKRPSFENYKEQYEKEREEYLKKLAGDTGVSRQEKQTVLTGMHVNIEKASDLMIEVQEESFPDHTGGDD
jgi:hypothetical protein